MCMSTSSYGRDDRCGKTFCSVLEKRYTVVFFGGLLGTGSARTLKIPLAPGTDGHETKV